MTEAVPAWLQAWRDGNCQPQKPAPPRPRAAKGIAPAKVSASGTAARKLLAIPAMSASALASKNLGFVEPERWAYDGGKRREPVLDVDHNPPRVVRKVGWRTCLACTNPFFSEDVIALRICVRCKTSRDQKKLLSD